MTGRRLYDHYCDAHRATQLGRWEGGRWVPTVALLAWPFLSRVEQGLWTDLATRTKPRR